MPTTADLAALLKLPKATRAGIAVALIDSLGETAWEDSALGSLAEGRAAELENGSVTALSVEEFFAGLEE